MQEAALNSLLTICNLQVEGKANSGNFSPPSLKNFPLQLKPRMLCSDTQRLAHIPATHLSTVDVVKDKVQFVSSLKREVEAHQERVFHILQQNIPFRHNMFLLEKGQLRFSGKFQLGTRIPR